MSGSRASRNFFRAFLVIGVTGLVVLVWHHSMIRPTNAVWWTWSAIVVSLNGVLGAVVGWVTVQPLLRKPTARERLAMAGSFFLGQMINTYAFDALGGTVRAWFWGLVVTSMALGFFVSRSVQACRSTHARFR